MADGRIALIQAAAFLLTLATRAQGGPDHPYPAPIGPTRAAVEELLTADELAAVDRSAVELEEWYGCGAAYWKHALGAWASSMALQEAMHTITARARELHHPRGA
jgi:hypothetical protein